MRTITTEELKTANRKAYQENKLAFQSPAPNTLYENDDGTKCSIGIALTQSELENCGSMRMPVSDLRSLRIVNFESMKFASQLQEAHDQIVRAITLKEEHANRLKYFQILIGLPNEQRDGKEQKQAA